MEQNSNIMIVSDGLAQNNPRLYCERIGQWLAENAELAQTIGDIVTYSRPDGEEEPDEVLDGPDDDPSMTLRQRIMLLISPTAVARDTGYDFTFVHPITKECHTLNITVTEEGQQVGGQWVPDAVGITLDDSDSITFDNATTIQQGQAYLDIIAAKVSGQTQEAREEVKEAIEVMQAEYQALGDAAAAASEGASDAVKDNLANVAAVSDRIQNLLYECNSSSGADFPSILATALSNCFNAKVSEDDDNVIELPSYYDGPSVSLPTFVRNAKSAADVVADFAARAVGSVISGARSYLATAAGLADVDGINCDPNGRYPMINVPLVDRVPLSSLCYESPTYMDGQRGIALVSAFASWLGMGDLRAVGSAGPLANPQQMQEALAARSVCFQVWPFVVFIQWPDNTGDAVNDFMSGVLSVYPMLAYNWSPMMDLTPSNALGMSAGSGDINQNCYIELDYSPNPYAAVRDWTYPEVLHSVFAAVSVMMRNLTLMYHPVPSYRFDSTGIYSTTETISGSRSDFLEYAFNRINDTTVDSMGWNDICGRAYAAWAFVLHQATSLSPLDFANGTGVFGPTGKFSLSNVISYVFPKLRLLNALPVQKWRGVGMSTCSVIPVIFPWAGFSMNTRPGSNAYTFVRDTLDPTSVRYEYNGVVARIPASAVIDNQVTVSGANLSNIAAFAISGAIAGIVGFATVKVISRKMRKRKILKKALRAEQLRLATMNLGSSPSDKVARKSYLKALKKYNRVNGTSVTTPAISKVYNAINGDGGSVDSFQSIISLISGPVED